MGFETALAGWFILVAAGAGLAVAALIPAVMPLLRRYALARPNARSSHRVPTPQGGGAPVVAVVLAALAMCWALGVVAVPAFYLALALAALALAFVGAADDIRPLSAGLRLIIQAALVGLVVFCAPAEWRIAADMPFWLERALAVFAGVWFVNLTNFMDGIDGMMVSEGAPVAGALAAAAALGSILPAGGVFAAALAGALLGFFAYNRHPAKVFLGDVGSLPIGLIIAAVLFELAARVSVAAAVILPLYYVFDATETLFIRWRAGEKLTEAHRRHAYQNAVDGGWSVWRIDGWVLALNGLLALLAGLCLALPAAGFQMAFLGAALGATALVSRRFRSAKQ